MYGDVYNTTVNIDGNRVFSRTFYPGRCCCRSGMYMNSCFDFGFGSFGNGLGIGLGFAAGVALVPMMPAIIKGAWSGIKWIAKGVKNLWNNIFHKKSKSKTEKAE